MSRSPIALSLRRIAVVGGVVVMGLAGGTASAAAASAPDPGTPGSMTRSAQAAPASQNGTLERGGYRGTQGFNLCLLSRCSIGSGAPAEGGVGLVQGGNLCLLSYCEVK